jgi:urea-proton symporter
MLTHFWKSFVPATVCPTCSRQDFNPNCCSGIYTHIVFIVFGLMTNILVTAMLLKGGSAVITSLTGMPTTAACFLLPVGVVMYTLFGGIKATFLTDYVHTFTILIIIFIFAFTVYATSPILGSPGAVWELLQKAALEHPVAGNAQGSYLTMQSREGIIFFVINIAGNFGTVFCDNGEFLQFQIDRSASTFTILVPDVTRFFIYHRIKLYSAPDLQKGYYNKAVAAHPVSALPGYIMGGLSWFAIPWLCATTMGLSALALEGNPAFPTYPNRLSDTQVSAGLVLPNSAVALLGQGGAICTLLMVFMAVTSASSAELIAVSTIFTYDIYQSVVSVLIP